jgi:hypothetical protein
MTGLPLSSPDEPKGLWRWLLFAGIVVVGLGEVVILWLALHPHVDPAYRAYYIEQTTTCLDKPVGGRYLLGATVSFLPDDAAGAREIRVCGWDGPAGDGTHSVGTTSRLRFAVEKPARDLVLRLFLTAIEEGGAGPQRIAIASGNGMPLGEATIPAGGKQTVEVPVPPEAFEEGVLDIVISYPDAVEITPRDSNTHYRSIKLLALQLRRQGDVPSAGPLDDPRTHRFEPGISSIPRPRVTEELWS